MNTAPSKTSLFQYSFLALPLAFAGLPLYIHVPDFYTRDLGLSIGLIGIILLIIRLFDAFQDPIIGYISDKYAQQRFAITAVGIIALTLGITAAFYGPQFKIPTAAWFTASMIIATTGFSIVAINLTMIGGLWRDEENYRTNISAWREAFGLVGLLIASILPTALQSSNVTEEPLRVFVWIFIFLTTIAFILFTRFMRKLPSEHVVTKQNTQSGFFFLTILVGPNRKFFSICFLTHLAASIPAVMILFFIRDYLQAENLVGLFLLLYFISGALLMALWVKLSNKLGKEKAWLISILLSIATFIWAYFLEPGDILAYGIICVLSGMALGADLALPPSILADRVTKLKDENKATQYYAVLAFIPKMAIAIASGFSFLILDYLGFEAGISNSENALHGLIVLYALAPCFIKLIAALLLWQLNWNQGDKNENTERNSHHGTHSIS